MSDSPAPPVDAPDFGERVDGIDVPVFNERAVRAAAGFLFVFGAFGWMTAYFQFNATILETALPGAFP